MTHLSETLAHLFHPRRSNNRRARVLHPEAFFFLVLIVLGFISLLRVTPLIWHSTSSILGYASSIAPSGVLEGTNSQRQQAGLAPLTLNDRLSQAALAKGQHMFANQYWAHTAPDGTEPWFFMRQAGYQYSVAGENLARDFSDTSSMVSAWMASPTHRSNIMHSRYTEIGIAVIDGVLQGHETTLVVQMFGTPKVAAAQVNDQAANAQPKQASTRSVEQAPAEAEISIQEESLSPPAADPANPGAQKVLASTLLPLGSLERPPLFTPLQLTKAFFLAVIMMVVFTLLYDGLVIGHYTTMRMVGRNLAHVALFLVVAFLVIFFKGGVIG